jgi:autoinducer 2 (AI-2) kinase
MRKRYLLGLDAGGGGIRSLLADIDSGEKTSAFQSWSHPPAKGVAVWGVDFDVDVNWKLVGKATRQVLELAGAGSDDIAGIAVSGMRFGTVLLDSKGRTIFAVPNRDARASSRSMELAGERGQEIFKLTGHWPGPIFSASRLYWLASSDPNLFENACTLLGISDWLSYRLCDEISTDYSQAGGTLLFGIKKREWEKSLIKSLELPNTIFPDVLESGTKLGLLTEEAQDNIGVKSGTPVIVGGADTQCGLLGSGITSSGQIGIVAGTTSPIQLVIDKPLIDEEERLWTGLHLTKGLWVLESNAGTMGESVEWIAGILYPDSPNGTASLMGEALKAEPGASGLFSTMGAHFFSAKEINLPVGNLTLTHTTSKGADSRKNLARAVAEGTAYSIRLNIEQILEKTGSGSADIRLSGGMSQSMFWSQMLSDVMDRPLQAASVPQASALGAAVCAGVGAGIYSSFEEAVGILCKPAYKLKPDPSMAQKYSELFSDWEQFRQAQEESNSIASVTIVKQMLSRPAFEPLTEKPPFKPRIFITADLDTDSIKALEKLGDVTHRPFRKEMELLSGPDMVEALRGYHVFVTEVDLVDSDTMQNLKNLRVIAVCRSNPVNIDIAGATALGIPVINTAGRNSEAVADLTVGFMLMLARKLPEASLFLKNPEIEAGDTARMGQAFMTLQGRELWNKTVGIIGMGAVGRAVSKRLISFGTRILAYDPHISPEETASHGALPVQLEKLLADSDFVSMHAAATDKTRGMIGSREISLMKQGAFLINTARAALIDEDALIEALRSGRLGGAGIDVFPEEPPGSKHPLLRLPNVIATPHIAGNTFEVAIHQGRTVVDQLSRLIQGAPLTNIVNPEVLTRFTWSGPRKQPAEDLTKELSGSQPPAVTDLQQKNHDQNKKPQIDKPEAPAEMPSLKGKGIRLLSILFGRKRKSEKHEKSQVSSTLIDEAAKKHLQRIIERFINYVSQDVQIKTFSSDRQLTIQFRLTDIETDFYIDFQKGAVNGGQGAPPRQPDVQLKMKAGIFDEMFTGRINPARAALSGKISFSGDTGKAMSIQKIQKEIKRLYLKAREEIGEPSGLSSSDRAKKVKIPRSEKAGSDKPGKSVSRKAKLAGAARIKTKGDVRDEAIEVIQELYDTGMITSTGGNLSVRVNDSADSIWITPSRLFKGNIRPDMMVRLGLDGRSLDPDGLSPSSEHMLHCAIYRVLPDVNAVIHAHPPQTTILGLTDLPFLPISTEAAFIGEIPRIPFIMPGSKELADKIAESIGKSSAVIMKNHGLIATGSSLRRAADITLVIEETAEALLTCYKLGKTPPVLPEETVAKLREVGEMMT